MGRSRWRRGPWVALAGVAALSVAGYGLRRSWPSLFPGPLEQGWSAYGRGDWREASAQAGRRLRTAPGDLDALRLLARASARMGRHDVAQKVYGRLKVDGMGAEDLVLLASGLIRQNKSELAQSTLALALQKDPDHSEALFELARLHLQADRLAPASRLAKRLANRPGWEARGEVLLGLVLREQHDPLASAAALDRALRLDPTLKGATAKPAAVRKWLARDLLEAGRPAEVRDPLRVVLAAGDDPEASWLLGRASLQEGAPPESVGEAGATAVEEFPQDPEPAPYVGSARCVECHPANYRTQQASAHAKTFRAGHGLDELALPDRPVPDPIEPKVVHNVSRNGAGVRAAARVAREEFRALVEFALGSGDRGLTLVGRDDAGQARELRLSHYNDGSGWGLTTGHAPSPRTPDGFLGKVLSDDEVRRCLGCHTTNFRAALTRSGPESADRGIGCERCHGPAGNHLKAVEAGLSDPAIARPRLSTAEQVVGLCGQCHSPPGEVVTPSTPAAVRFQASTLTWSRCYTESRDALSCTTCHDPHRDAETSADYYGRKCLACHSAAPSARVTRDGTRPVALGPGLKRVPCPVNAEKGCIGCHMPTVADAVPHSSFTDHHIRVYRPITPTGR